MEKGSVAGGVGGGASGSGSAGDGDPAWSAPQGKSCKGCLYFSSILKSDSRSPICIGLTRPLEDVPSYIVGESELEADKEGRSLSNFKYVCVGYSVFVNSKDGSIQNQENATKLPFCAGLELLVDRRTSTERVPVHVQNTEEAPTHFQPAKAKPENASRSNFFDKFTRSAGIVALGVGRNLVRVGYSIKNNFEDILYDRKRPK
ncbi:uncharacterized protein LOC122041385 [Zingiber officinale]|uniref:uncharacterized protein LOC122041385 n=1 Tax=Zingiber officinale TaxID=94328 RepID=UPI001C4C0090|nr:uncharacterized protein LOC122041385 [Zingiber officinale]